MAFARRFVAAAALWGVSAGSAGAGPARVVKGGPKEPAAREQLAAALGRVAPALEVCWRGPRPATITVELAVAAGGEVASSRQVTAGPVAQCAAGVLAVQRLAAGKARFTATIELGTEAAAAGDMALVDEDLRAQRGELQACQQAGAGRVVVRFLIQPDGRITEPAIESSTAGEPVKRCVLDTLARLRVRERAGRKVLSFSLALDFAAGGDAPGAPAGEPSLVPSKSGPLDGDVINRIVRGAEARFRGCQKRAGSTGLVRVRATIRADGRPYNVAVKESTLGDRAIEGCLVKVMESLRFPAETGRADTRVIYPFQV